MSMHGSRKTHSGQRFDFEEWLESHHYHMDLKQQGINFSGSDKVTWLADEIFKAFPETVTGLTFYTLDCGCLYYQRKYADGDLDHKVGIYRDAEDGPCEKCMAMDETWKDRIVDEIVVYNSKFQIG